MYVMLIIELLVLRQFFCKYITNVQHDGRTHQKYFQYSQAPYPTNQRKLFKNIRKGQAADQGKELCGGLRKLAVEGEEGENGDQVGRELVLLEAPLHRVQEWGRQDFE